MKCIIAEAEKFTMFGKTNSNIQKITLWKTIQVFMKD